MITSQEYRNMFIAVQELNLKDIWLDDDEINVLDEIRRTNIKYKKEIDYLAVYPRHNIKKAEGYIKDIEEDCKKVHIRFEIIKLRRAKHMDSDTQEAYRVDEFAYQEGIHIRFYKQDLDLTYLINVNHSCYE